MMQKKVRVGIIGCGGIGIGIHLLALREIELCELAWTCDIIEERAKDAAEQFGAPKYGTLYKELLKEDKPDAVFVLVQPEQAFRISYDCLMAGCNVFVEKPFGITSYQAESLLRTAKQQGVQLQVGFNRRFIPMLDVIKEKLKDLGPIHQIDGWFYKNGDAAFYDGCSSAFTCDVIHVIDLVRHLAGGEAVKTFQVASRFGESPVNNSWNSLIAFDNGVVGVIHSNYESGGRIHGFTIHTSDATIIINVGFGGPACSATILYSSGKAFSLASQGARPINREELDGIAIAGEDRYELYYGYEPEDKAFLEAIANGTKVACDAEDALKTMKLLDMMQASEFENIV